MEIKRARLTKLRCREQAEKRLIKGHEFRVATYELQRDGDATAGLHALPDSYVATGSEIGDMGVEFDPGPRWLY